MGERRLRLNKALSGAGLGSRRAVEELVRAGRVSIGGEVVQDLGRRVDPVSDRVEVDGSRVVLDERRRYWLLNKPAGVVSTAADPEGRPTVVGMVPEQPRVFPVGRLDRDTEGLLLLTNDGPLAYRLTHARYGIEKRYLAEVERLPADAPGRLRKGVELEDGFARPTRVRVVAGSGRRRMIEVVLVEGRNREVRRLLDAVGAPVRRLVRTAVGPIRLTGLAPGEFRPLRPRRSGASTRQQGYEEIHQSIDMAIYSYVDRSDTRPPGARPMSEGDGEERLVALRGATTVEADTAEAVIERTRELLSALLERNAVEHDQLVSIIFTSTKDLRSAFPALAARELGLGDVPLLCAGELDVVGGNPNTIRVLVHCYSTPAEGQPAPRLPAPCQAPTRRPPGVNPMTSTVQRPPTTSGAHR